MPADEPIPVLTPQDASQSLAQIQQVMHDTRAALKSLGSDRILIIWGLIWILGYTFTHFLPHHAGIFWLPADVLGILLTFLIMRLDWKRKPIRSLAMQRMGWKIGILWFALFCLICLWMTALRPTDPKAINLIIITGIMFAYVVMGLLLDAWFLLYLGLAISLTSSLGFFLLTDYFWLWMSVTGGGLLLGAGLYLHWRWR